MSDLLLLRIGRIMAYRHRMSPLAFERLVGVVSELDLHVCASRSEVIEMYAHFYFRIVSRNPLILAVILRESR